MKGFAAAALFIAALALTAGLYARHTAAELEGSIVRLHVIAESDSEYDQRLKLKARDAVLEAVRDMDARSGAAYAKAAEDAANFALGAERAPYRARAEYGTFIFPRKTYGRVTLPAGRYKGVRVLLGSGEGANWWCVMYPPLCVSGNEARADCGTESVLRRALSDDTYELITEDSEIKLRVVELFNKYFR